MLRKLRKKKKSSFFIKKSVIALENCRESPLRHFTETLIFAWFREFVYNVLSKIVYKENSAIFAGKKTSLSKCLF